MRPIIASMTTAPSVALGRFSNSVARNSIVARMNTALISDAISRLLARVVGDRGLRQAAVDDEAADETRRAVRHSLRDELLVRVDLVAVLARDAPRGSERLRVADEDDRQRTDQELPRVAPADPRQADREQAGRDVAGDRDAVVREVERRSTAMIDSATTISARGSFGANGSA